MTSWPTIPEEIKVWLSDWEAEVQDMRFDEASRRFHPQTCAFGTVMHAGQDLQSLICDQWQVVWPRTRNFRFHMDSARAWGDAEHHVVAAADDMDVKLGRDIAQGRDVQLLNRPPGRLTERPVASRPATKSQAPKQERSLISRLGDGMASVTAGNQGFGPWPITTG